MPATAAPTPTPGKPAQVPLPPAGRAPDGSVVGGDRMASRGIIAPRGARLPGPLAARAWLVADLDTGAVLAARDPHAKYLPASTLKVLTALTLIPRLDRRKVVVATTDDANIEGSRVGLVPGGKYTVDQLFQSLLLMSGNDAANALARTAGGVPRTVQDMNTTAAGLRAYDTHAATPSGLEGPGQSISAYDLALISRAAFKLADFRRYDSQLRGKVPAQPPKYHSFEISNQNRLLWDYPGGIGGKTGFTDAARHTYVGMAQRGGRRLVVTMLYGEHQPTLLWKQAAALLDWGFAQPRSAAGVGNLVDPGPPPAVAPTGTPIPAPTPASGQQQDQTAAQDTGTGGSRARLVLGIGGGLVLAAGAGAGLRRRRRRAPLPG
jgi:D-alanyl-D-alanine carboxypeptidase (penicillin-binding protein 5/6)